MLTRLASIAIMSVCHNQLVQGTSLFCLTALETPLQEMLAQLLGDSVMWWHIMAGAYRRTNLKPLSLDLSLKVSTDATLTSGAWN